MTAKFVVFPTWKDNAAVCFWMCTVYAASYIIHRQQGRDTSYMFLCVFCLCNVLFICVNMACILYALLTVSITFISVCHFVQRFTVYTCTMCYILETTLGLFYWQKLSVIPAWISNHMPSKVWDEIIFPLSNFNGCTVDVREWISNFIMQFIMDVLTTLYWD